MKTLQEQYNLIKEGKGHKGVFLNEAKRNFPNLITNSATFEQAEKILKNKSVLNENYVDLKPITQLTSDDFNPNKQNWENKFEAFLAEEKAKSLKPVINDEEKVNTKEQDEKIKAETKKVDGTVENIEKRNYDYSPKVDNINNVNAQEMMNGVYYEIKENPELSLEEAQEKVIKNLAKDELHYVKEGQFGTSIGYTETEVEENSGKTYGGSGYSDKLKKSDTKMKPIKEDLFRKLIKEGLGGVVTSGNPDSLAAQSGNMIRQMMSEDEFQANQAGSQYHSSLYNEVEEKDLPMDESEEKEEKPTPKKPKRAKKESIDTKLAEIGKEAEAVKLEAQLNYLHEYIQEKLDRVNSIQEDANLSELIDKKKMKDMQKEIKLLEKKKAAMEKIYEKSCGKKYQREEIVDEEIVDEEVVNGVEVEEVSLENE